MKILVLNSGSTSIKFKLFIENNLKLDKKGEISNVSNHGSAIRQLLRQIGDLSEIKAVGHRFVHGGHDFYEPTEVSDSVFKSLEKYNQLAPLHNPHNLAGVAAMREYLPQVKNFAVFDTGFYRNLPLVSKLYALPMKYFEGGIERFGFHGLSHESAARQACQKEKKIFEKSKIISIHLGGGSSITAIFKGQPIETSMGFTPLEGLVMQTRCGDLDPSIVLKLVAEASPDKLLALKEVSEILNSNSGLKGLSGFENFLDLLAALKKDQSARLAFEIYIHRLKKYLGAYWALLDGVDLIVFTGKIGAGRPITRQKVVSGLSFLKKVPVVAIETNEELLIAQKVKELL